jgi:hypothetical protein
MSIPVACATCGVKLKAPDAAAGRTLKCPQCGTAVVVPSRGPDKPSEAVQTTSPIEYVEASELVELIEPEIVPVQPRFKPKGIPDRQSRRENEVYATPVDDYDPEPRSRRRRDSAVRRAPHSDLVLSLSILGGLLLIVVLTAVLLSGRSDDGKQAAPNNPPFGNQVPNNPLTKPVPIAVSARQLVEEYKDNEVRANDKYRWKILQVSGTIHQIRDAPNGRQVIVELKPGTELLVLDTVMCSFNQSDREAVSQLSKGNELTVEGLCEGKVLFGVGLQNCKLVK